MSKRNQGALFISCVHGSFFFDPGGILLRQLDLFSHFFSDLRRKRPPFLEALAILTDLSVSKPGNGKSPINVGFNGKQKTING
jgi:hypothetical protein